MNTLRRSKKSGEFSWDKEHKIGKVQVGKYLRKILKLAELKGELFVVILDEKFFKEKWNPISNFTCRIEYWDEVVKIINSELENYHYEQKKGDEI